MSRRRPEPGKGTLKRYIRVRIVCHCNHVLGYALKHPELLPAYRYSLSPSMTFVDAPEQTPTSGRATARCPQCYADIEIRWDRIVRELDRLDDAGSLSELYDERRDVRHADGEIRA